MLSLVCFADIAKRFLMFWKKVAKKGNIRVDLFIHVHSNYNILHNDRICSYKRALSFCFSCEYQIILRFPAIHSSGAVLLPTWAFPLVRKYTCAYNSALQVKGFQLFDLIFELKCNKQCVIKGPVSYFLSFRDLGPDNFKNKYDIGPYLGP